MRYQAIYERANDGTIWGYVPDLPGATGAGDSLDDAKASLLEGVRLWIEVTKERGEAIPKPSTIATDTIEVPAA
ncbi:MAG: type II toxin-antitoxin system HicB family antitoxin [Vulcanimicrobiaceae bacterium]